MVCIGDIHISLKSNTLAFEQTRLAQLAEHILQNHPGKPISILGDTFDTNKPNLQEIKLFYDFIAPFSGTPISIINGNHDATVFLYLPHIGFTYYHTPTVVGDYVYIGHSSISMIEMYKDRGLILMSHARCDLGFASSEIDFDMVSKGFKYTVLGDIHHPVPGLPKNVTYTLEPTRNSYTKHKEKTTGYIVLEDGKFLREFPKIVHKDLVEFGSVEEFRKWRPVESNLYKVRITDKIENFPKYTRGEKYKMEFIPVISVVTADKVTEELRNIVEQKVSISDVLMEFTWKQYEFSLETFNRIKRRLL